MNHLLIIPAGGTGQHLNCASTTPSPGNLLGPFLDPFRSFLVFGKYWVRIPHIAVPSSHFLIPCHAPLKYGVNIGFF